MFALLPPWPSPTHSPHCSQSDPRKLSILLISPLLKMTIILCCPQGKLNMAYQALITSLASSLSLSPGILRTLIWTSLNPRCSLTFKHESLNVNHAAWKDLSFPFSQAHFLPFLRFQTKHQLPGETFSWPYSTELDAAVLINSVLLWWWHLWDGGLKLVCLSHIYPSFPSHG